jgi:hypothetical protein
MEIIPVKSWKMDFARSAEPERFREMMRRAQEETRKKDKEEKAEAEAGAEAALDVLIMATANELAAFDVTVNHYETATYEALIENERLLDLVRREQEQMLEKAYTLPDGRKVFESEDGLRVFDTEGNELDASVITPEEIEDWRPKYEAFQADRDELAALEAQRAEIIAYQERLALAREQVEDGDISQADLAELERDLAAEMPDAVRNELPPELRPERELDEENKPQPVAAFKPAGNLDMPAL